LPLNIKSQRSSAKMRALNPKLEKLRKSFSNNPQRLQEEQMKLYSEEGINPMASCLPLFIQLPILYGVFDVVYRPITHIIRAGKDVIAQATEITKGLLTDVSKETLSNFNQRPEIYIVKEIQKNPDAFSSLDAEFVENVTNFNNKLFGIVDLGDIPTLKPEVWNTAAIILILIPFMSGIIQLIMTVYSQIRSKKLNPDAPSMAGMNIMLYVMPVFSVWIAFSFPAGIGFYWTMSSLFSFVQSIILYKIYTPEYVAKLVEKDKEKRKHKKRPNMMERYQQMMEEQMGQQTGAPVDNSRKIATAKSSDDESGEVKLSRSKQKEYEKMIIREARRRQAEKYGEEFIDDDDEE